MTTQIITPEERLAENRGVQHHDVRLEHARGERSPRKREARGHTEGAAQHESEHGLFERHEQVSPQRAGRHPHPDAKGNVAGPADEKGIDEASARCRFPGAEKYDGEAGTPRRDGRTIRHGRPLPGS